MPIKLGKKTHKTFESAAKAIAKKKGISIDRARAYVATVDRKQHPSKTKGKGKAKK